MAPFALAEAVCGGLWGVDAGGVLAGGTHFVQIVEVMVLVIVETDSVVIVLLPWV